MSENPVPHSVMMSAEKKCDKEYAIVMNISGAATEETKEEYRLRREKECFSVINRGQLWYEGISITQLLELRKWYKDWLAVTETMVIPEKPEWLE